MAKKICRLRWLILGGIILQLSSCTFRGVPIERSIPINRFESPEINNGENSLSFGYTTAPKIRLTGSITESPPDTTTPELSTGEAYLFGYSFGITDYLEIGIDSALTGDTGGLYAIAGMDYKPKIKLQIFGEPLKRSEPGNFSLALSFSGGKADVDDNAGDDQDTFAKSEDYGVLDSSWLFTDLSLIVGYRLYKYFLIYANTLTSKTEFNGTWKIKNGDGRGDDEVLIDSGHFSGLTETTGSTIGFTLGNQTFFSAFEITQFETRSGESVLRDTVGGVKLNIVF